MKRKKKDTLDEVKQTTSLWIMYTLDEVECMEYFAQQTSHSRIVLLRDVGKLCNFWLFPVFGFSEVFFSTVDASFYAELATFVQRWWIVGVTT